MDKQSKKVMNICDCDTIETIKLVLGRNKNNYDYEITIPINDFKNVTHNFNKIVGKIVRDDKIAVVYQCKFYRNGNCKHDDECKHAHCDKIDNIDQYKNNSKFVKSNTTTAINNRVSEVSSKTRKANNKTEDRFSSKKNFVSTRDLSKQVRDDFSVLRNMIIGFLLTTGDTMTDKEKCQYLKVVHDFAYQARNIKDDDIDLKEIDDDDTTIITSD